MKKIIIGLVAFSSISAFAQSEFLPGKIVDARSRDEIRVKCLSASGNACKTIQYVLYDSKDNTSTAISRSLDIENLKSSLTNKSHATRRTWGFASVISNEYTTRPDDKEPGMINSKAEIISSEILNEFEKFGVIRDEETILGSVALDAAKVVIAAAFLPIGVTVDVGGTAVAIITTPVTLTYDGINTLLRNESVHKLSSIVNADEEVEVSLIKFRKIVNHLRKLR